MITQKGVSFITVIRNVEFVDLKMTINSISQNCKVPNYEIILQDGSDTKSNFDFDNKVKYFYQKDNGIYNAMNFAIEKASYTHLFFINVGDLLLDDSNNLDLDNIKDVQYFNYVRDFEYIYSPQNLTRFYMLRNALCHQSQVYPKRLVTEIGCYNEIYKVLADQDLSLRLYLSGVSFVKLKGFICRTAPMGFSANNKKLRDIERKQLILIHFKKNEFLRLFYFFTFPKLREKLIRIKTIKILRIFIINKINK
jgi:hypothetical protein